MPLTNIQLFLNIYISDYLANRQAFDIVIKNNILDFKIKYDRSDFHLTMPIDEGEFIIINKDGGITLTYEIFFYGNFLANLLICIAAGFGSKSILLGLLLFFALHFPYMLLTFIKHRIRFNKITTGIESLIKQKAV